LADVTARGGATALVDADDTFDPSSGARAGIDLRRLLWVRCAASGLAGAASGLAGAASGLAGAASGLAGAASGLAGASRRQTALAATDLLVRCPGFTLIVLDTGEIAPRLTLGATFRFRLAVQRADTALVILARQRIAGAAATVAIETTREAVEWSGP